MGAYFLEELGADNTNRRKRQCLRANSGDIFDMDELTFINNFRLNKDAFEYVLSEIEGSFLKQCRSSSVPTKIKLAACLRFLAQGRAKKLSVANDHNINIAQPTFSKIFSSVLNILEEKLCPKWIKFEMTQYEMADAKDYFYDKCQIPGIIMCVDGTDIKILQPTEDMHLYLNRKGYFSMNALIICDHKLRIRYIDARYQGANHDSHIWNISAAKRHLKNLYDSGDKHTRILGDSGYPLEPWLLTPFRNPAEGTNEVLFNKKHAKDRNIIERTIGVLKSRFRCLLQMRSLHYKPSKVVKIVNVCSALHNICIHYGVSYDEANNCSYIAVEKQASQERAAHIPMKLLK